MLNDDRTALRAWSESDLEFLGQLRNNIELQESLMTQPRPNSALHVKEWLIGKSGNDNAVFFIIADPDSGVPLGFIQAMNINHLHGVGELGICLDPEQQGKGHAKRALQLMKDYLQRTFGLRKLVLQVLSENQRAITFYQDMGFSVVGHLGGHFYSRGEYRDVIIMEALIES